MVTREEHAEEHRKLYEQYGRWQDKVAWMGWAGMAGKEEIIFMKNSLAHKGKKPWLGKKLSEETKLKISLKNRGKQPRLGAILSEATKRKISLANTGSKSNLGTRWSINSRERLSNLLRGKKAPHREKSYTVLFPDGHKEEIRGLSRFAKMNDLNAGNLLGKSGSKRHFARKIGK